MNCCGFKTQSDPVLKWHGKKTVGLDNSQVSVFCDSKRELSKIPKKPMLFQLTP